MEKPSPMMAGTAMHTETDALRGQAVGSAICITGRELGMQLSVQEVVVERLPPMRKRWETRGEPRLLVIGAYQMGYIVKPRGKGAHLVVCIDYQLPNCALSRLPGRVFDCAYAAWCTQRMAGDAITVSEISRP